MKNSVTSLVLNNGQKMPTFGLGTWKSKPGDVETAVKTALDAGYRHIDCAHIYLNEREVGAALKSKMADGTVKREDLFITSKLWCTFHRPDLVEPALRTTLQNLGLDYLDMYLIHWPQAYKEGEDLLPKDASGKVAYSAVDYVDTWKAMELLMDKGLVKGIGLSNFNKAQIQRVIAEGRVRPAVLQIECHPYLNQQKLISFARVEGIAVTAYSPLGSPDRPGAKSDDPSLMDDPRLVAIAKKHGKSVAQILIRYAIDRGLCVIPKSVTPSRIRQNADVWDLQLSADELAAVEALECNGRVCTMGDVDHKDYPFHDEY